MAGILFDAVIKLNPYHDERGRFSTAGSAASFTYKPGASTAHDKAIEREKERTGAAAGFKGTLYHGSPAKDIEEFDMSLAGKNTSSGEKLLFFTDSKQMADDFSYERLEGSSKFFQRRGEKGRVYEVDVEIKKPLDLRNLSDQDIDNLMKLDVDGILTRKIAVELSAKNNQQLKTYLDLTAENLISLGYDGLIANTGKAGHNSTEYAVVDSGQAKIKKSAQSFEDVLKFNPYHDRLGRFASSGNATSFTYAPGKSKAHDLAIAREKDRKRSETLSRLSEEIRHKKTEHAYIVDDDGQVIFGGEGNENHFEFKGVRYDDIKGTTMLHNHPDEEYGGTFSHSDVITFTSYGLKETRVVAAEGTYILRRGEESPIGFPSAYKEAISGFVQPTDWQYNERGRNIADKIWGKYRDQLEAYDKKVGDCYRSGDTSGAQKWEAKYAEMESRASKEVNSAMRREFVQDNHSWFVENAPKYNVEYEFIPAAGAKNSVGKSFDEEDVDLEIERVVETWTDTDGIYADDIQKAGGNPYHDPKTGRFTTGPAGGNPMIRKGPPPKNTKIAYKVFVVKDGKLYPPMVANPDAMDTPVGVWLDASEGKMAMNKDGTPVTNTLGRNKVVAGGKGTQGGSGQLAYRPGWHLGELPEAKQFYTKDKVTGEKKQKKNFVWAECEIAADFDYQAEAMSYGYNKNGKFQHSLAGLPKLPKDGYYTYRTNPDPTTQPWYITGSMKVNRILTDAETNKILRAHGIEPMKRDGGELDLKALGITETNFVKKSDPVEKSADGKSVLFIGLKIAGADDLAIEGGENHEDFHVTLAYGYFDQGGHDEDSVDVMVQGAIKDIRELIPDEIRFDRLGRFDASEGSDGMDVIYAGVAAGQLEKVHDDLLKALEKRGISLEVTFPEYHPHMTLAYIDPKEEYELSEIQARGEVVKVMIGHGRESSKENNYTIMKADDDKRLIFGWASIAITADGEQLEDRQHDMIDPEDLEEAVYEYVLNFRDMGEEHIPTMRKKGKLVESCMLTEEKQRAMGIPPGIVPIGWWIGFKIDDDEAWAKVKNGTYKMFSIEGRANRVPVEKAVGPVEKSTARSFDELMKTRTIGKADPGRFDTIVEVGKTAGYDTIVEVEKFNPYHDERGRFASANGAASFTYAPGKSRAHNLAIARATAKERVAKAKADEPKLTAAMQGCAKEVGGELVGLEYCVKGEGSLTRKINTEMSQNGSDVKAALGEMRDVNRYTMQLREDNFVSGFEKTMSTLQSQGYEVVKVKNTMKNETAGYRGVNTNLKSPDGTVWELQFHTAKSLEIKEVNHKLYEIQRKDNTSPAKRAELETRMGQNAKSIPTPAGIEKIGDINKL